MDEIPESSTTLAWLWVIEALASFKEIEFFILHGIGNEIMNLKEIDVSAYLGCLITYCVDVIESAPELPDEEGKKAREFVALRCLESLFGRTRVNGKNDAPAQDSKVRFDLSESSEDVLQRILYETSELDIRMGGPGMLRWDISQFISHKRACMPKCELQQLKDTMLDDTHPYADLLKVKSGLTWMGKNIRISEKDVDCNGVERSTKSDDLGAQGKLVLENQNGNPNTPLIEEDPPGGKTLVSKRKRLNFPSTIMIDHYNENHDVICGGESDDVPMNAKKQKQFSRSSNDLEALDQAVLCGKKVLEESSDKIVSNAETQECSLMEDPMVSAEKGTDKKDFDGKCDSPKNIRHGDNFFEDQLDNIGACVKAQEACGGEAHQDTGVIEVLIEPSTSKFSPLGCSNHHPSADTNSNFEQDFLIKKSNVGSHDHDQEQVRADQMEVDMDHSIETEILIDSDGYHDEQIGVIKEKNKFLSSQCSINDDSSLPTDWTELNLCMKCNEVGQLLYCNNSTCPLAIHTQCLGIFASFNEKGEFYCPFCAYSLAMSEHLDAKKKASLAKRELASFIHSGLHSKDKNPSANNGNDNHCKSIDSEHLEEVEVCLGKIDVKVGEHVNVVHNLESSQKKNDKHDHDAPFDFVNSQPREIDAALTKEAIGNIVGRKDEVEQMALKPAFVAGTDKPEDQEDIDSKGDHYVSNERIGNKVLLPDREQEEAGLQLIVYQPKEVDYALNIVEDSSENDEESILCRYSIKFREPKNHYSYPPSFQLRRKRVHWTSEEEEILKEGVEKFFTVHDRTIPWMKILEFGSAVFYKGRTAVDLKDKWRNMCKSQS